MSSYTPKAQNRDKTHTHLVKFGNEAVTFSLKAHNRCKTHTLGAEADPRLPIICWIPLVRSIVKLYSF